LWKSLANNSSRIMVLWRPLNKVRYWIPMFGGTKLQGLMPAKTGIAGYKGDRAGGVVEVCIRFDWHEVVPAQKAHAVLTAQKKGLSDLVAGEHLAKCTTARDRILASFAEAEDQRNAG
jgi:hypothetical protein